MCVISRIEVANPMSTESDSGASSSSEVCIASKPAKKQRAHLVVQHHYHDHAYDPSLSDSVLATDESETSDAGNINSSNSPTAFPLRLYEMLIAADKEGFSDVVSWQPHGRCFVVHKPEQFKTILPRFFKLSKVASFQRQLNLYGYTRLTTGMDKGGYYNELFLRGMPSLCHKIHRVKVKGTGVRAKSNPAQEPNFWRMQWVTSSSSRQAQLQQGAAATPTCVTQFDFHGASSVVSHDEDEQRADQVMYPPSSLHQEEQEHQQEEQQQQFQVEENERPMAEELEEDSLVFSWGMPFHYLPRHPLVETPPDVVSSHKLHDSNSCSKQALDNFGLEEFMKVLMEHDRNSCFSQLLEHVQ